NSPPLGFESRKPFVSAVIFSSLTDKPFHWSSHQSLHQWLKSEGVTGLVGIDTRNLIRKIRQTSSLLGSIGLNGPKKTELSFFDPNTQNLLPFVSTERGRRLGKGKIRIGLI